MTELICGRCGEKFTSEKETDSDEYCPICLSEMEEEMQEQLNGYNHSRGL